MNSIQLTLFLPKNHTEANTPPLTQLVDTHRSKLVATIEAAQSAPGHVVKLILPYGVEIHLISRDTPDNSEQSWAAQLFEQLLKKSQLKAEEYSHRKKMPVS